MTEKQKQLLLVWFDCLPVSGVDGIWGPQSRAATVKLQKKLGLPETGDFDSSVRSAALKAMCENSEPETGKPAEADWWKSIRYFSPGEFACKCGQYHEPYCDGYPHEIQPLLVQIADRARSHFGMPIAVVSGLRCPQHNRDSNGVENSQHMYGEAADVYVYGVSQGTALNWFLQQKDVRYAYAIEGSDNIHFDIHPVGR